MKVSREWQNPGLIRYPGSKAKIVGRIIERFPDEMRRPLFALAANWEYREPFFGAGAVGLGVLRVLPGRCPVWLNDKDPWMAALWSTVRAEPTRLSRMILDFVPSEEAFYRFREQDGADIDPVEAGFRKLALHQISWSGLGAMAGGPLGGKNQGNTKHPVGCRWNPAALCKKVSRAHVVLRKFKAFRFTCGDFAPLLAEVPAECFIYLDPPYVEAGAALYKHSMNDSDHERLARLVRSLPCPWVLSYDDHPLVRRLYQGERFDDVHLTYTNARADGARRKNREVMVTPDETVDRQASPPVIPSAINGHSGNGKPPKPSAVSQAETLYRFYPRKVGKAAALKAIAKALARVPFVELLDAVQEYASSRKGKDPQFTPHPATWFNEGRWEDERDEWHRPEGNGRAKAARRVGAGERFDPNAGPISL
jgi:DNA adenine methylase